LSFQQIRRGLPATDPGELEATLVWNALVEPGDRISGILRSKLGNRRALEKLFSQDSKQVEDLAAEDLESAYRRWLPRYRKSLAAEVAGSAAKADARILLPTDEEWPTALSSLQHHSPVALWFRGNTKNFTLLNRSVAIVGSRTCTHYGQKITANLASHLVQNESAVVSGGALGVDSVAHRVTLARAGLTVAVMAGSLDNLYPSGNWQLFEEIAHSGLLVSEMVPGSKPTRWRFLQRNRLIAAISQAVVVTEAGWRSGSINTAGHAVELGRRVFAIPGPITEPSSAGCNRLIRDHLAELLLDTEELSTELGWVLSQHDRLESLGVLELRTLDALSRREQQLDSLLRATGLTLDELRLALGGLQTSNLAERGPENGWKRTK